MEHAARVCAHMLEYGRPLIADLGDEHRALGTSSGGKPAGWMLGHLAVSGDFVRRQFQRAPLTPREWGPRFGPGSRPSLDAADYPSMEALRAALEQVYGDLAECAPSVAAELLDRPNPFEGARRSFPTMRDFAVYLMTAHVGYHLGELAGWRVAVGLSPRSGR